MGCEGCVAPKTPAPLRTKLLNQPPPSTLCHMPPEILWPFTVLGAMADYFYASYHFDVPLPSAPESVETSTTRPWRARLASCWALWPEIRQCLEKRLLNVPLRVFSNKTIVSKVHLKQNRVPGGPGMYFCHVPIRCTQLECSRWHLGRQIPFPGTRISKAAPRVAWSTVRGTLGRATGAAPDVGRIVGKCTVATGVFVAPLIGYP